MTEKIIIDGVDVAWCYADKKKMKDGLYCFWEGGNCEYNKYCYYKECKRLEQENKELKEKYSHVLELAKTNADSNEYCLQELEKENDSMKKILVDIGFWDVNGNYREDFQTVERSELNGTNED